MYLPAIEGHVPRDMVRAFRAMLEFCYLVRRDVVDEPALTAIREALGRFHHYREIFRTTGVRPEGFGNLPCQHSMIHYPYLIEQYGACSGHCTSLTENLHIHTVKKPYRRSNKNEPLGQMLLANQRNDKLAAQRASLTSQGLLDGTCLWDAYRHLAQENLNDGDPNGGQPPGPDHPAREVGEAREEEDDGEGDGDGEVDGPVPGPRVDGHVVLARTPGEHCRWP